MKKIKVILSTNGPLHLIKSAEYLVDFVDLQIIQGWVPAKNNKFLFKILSKIVGRDINKGINKRSPEKLENKNISVGLPEFYYRFGKHILKRNVSANASKLYGKLTKKYMQSADILHVRSGSGQEAITRAKSKGLKVLVDHSIAHPAFMDKHLKSEYQKNNSPYNLGMQSLFWNNVVEDCKKADCILVNSDFVKETFIDEGFDASKIKVSYLGVRQDFIRIKDDYKIDTKLKILFTGNFIFRKGIEYIFKSLEILQKMNIDVEMTVIGTYETSKKLIKDYDLNNIQFKGFIPQDELKYYLSTSDIYLFPSLCEGCASSGMEAMAAGLPIVTTKESGLPIENEISGLVIPTKDENAIVKAILKLKKDKGLREKIGINAANKIANNYSWEHYASNVFEIYKSLLND